MRPPSTLSSGRRALPAPPAVFATEIRWLLQSAMLFFVFVAAIGILNGTDLVDFEHDELLTHVHAGTLGWITMSVFAATLWLFAGTGASAVQPGALMARVASVLAYGAILSILLYVYQFWTTVGLNRPRAGMAAGGVIVLFLIWALLRARTLPLSVPRLGILVAVATSVVGAVLGILGGLQLATGDTYLPDGGFDAHPATMVLGFLVPVGMGLAEWSLDPASSERPATRSGVAQMLLLFTGSMLLMIGLLVDLAPLVGLSLPFEVASVVLFLRRLWPLLRATEWRVPGPGRHSTMTALALVADLALFVYLIVRYQGNLDDTPEGEILALDHTMFVGVLTNVLFAMIHFTTARSASFWQRTDHLVFWGMNIGLIGFAPGLFFDVTLLKRVFTPLMGLAIFLGVAVFSARLHRPVTESTDPAAQAAAVP